VVHEPAIGLEVKQDERHRPVMGDPASGATTLE
jgi:hypothetical protein